MYTADSNLLRELLPLNSYNHQDSLKNLFSTLSSLIPLDGIVIAFLDTTTFTTYWLKHAGHEEIDTMPYAIVHTEKEITDFVNYSTWDSKESWIRLNQEKNQVVMTKLFMREFHLDEASIIQFRSSYDNSKKISSFFYVQEDNILTSEHLEILAQHQHNITLVISLVVKDFLLQKMPISSLSGEEQEEALKSNEIVTTSHIMSDIVQKLKIVASLPTPILIQGETGTGKEVMADFIHMNSTRKEMPFIKINCGAISPSLLDSELFGHEKGAFTGAINQKQGCFERAHNGTLFLDELGEMSLDAQVRFLRILQTGVYERLGSNKTIYSNVRIIAATNRNLLKNVHEGKFRKDLFHRLNVYPIQLPPLRERFEDLPLLVAIILRSTLKKLNLNLHFVIEDDNIEELKTYPWDGNIRELQNAIEASIINYFIQDEGNRKLWIRPTIDYNHFNFDNSEIQVDDKVTQENTLINKTLIRNETMQPSSDKLLSTFDEEVRSILIRAMKETFGKVYGQDGAAALLKLNPSTLWGKLNKYKIRPEQFQPSKQLNKDF